MPGRDGTGPLGQGSMTGRGMGICGGVNAGVRYGAGFGGGGRRAFRYHNMAAPALTKEALAAEKERLERGIKDIEAQINAMD